MRHFVCKPSSSPHSSHLILPTFTRPPHLRRFSSPRVRMSTTTSSANGPSSSPSDASVSPSSAIDFLTLCQRLKTTKRAGWVRMGVKESESVADHMYRMGVMALISQDIPGVDRNRCIKMALVHDIAEAIVGDITPADGVPKLEKSRREQEALDHMCKLLGDGSRAKEIAQLWTEYEESSTLEAKIVKDFDKIEMILQALEYETEQGSDLEEFFVSTAGIAHFISIISYLIVIVFMHSNEGSFEGIPPGNCKKHDYHCKSLLIISASSRLM